MTTGRHCRSMIHTLATGLVALIEGLSLQVANAAPSPSGPIIQETQSSIKSEVSDAPGHPKGARGGVKNLSEALARHDGPIKLCHELEGNSLGAIAYALPRRNVGTVSEQNLCFASRRQAPAIATLRHGFGCSAPDTLALSSWIAQWIDNPAVISERDIVLIPRRTLAQIAETAVAASRDERRVPWSLLHIRMRSESPFTKPSADQSLSVLYLKNQVDTVGGAALNLSGQEAPGPWGILLWNPQSARIFPDRSRSSVESTLLRGTGRWPAFESETWEWLSSDSSPWRKTGDPGKTIQNAERMGDLADIIVLAALRGELSSKSFLTERTVTYWIEGRHLVPTSSNQNSNSATVSFERLQLQESNCQQSLTKKWDEKGSPSDHIDVEKALRSLRHIRRTTYSRVLALAQTLKQEPKQIRRLAAKQTDQTAGVPSRAAPLLQSKLPTLGIALPEESLLAFAANIKKTSEILKRNCLAGRLQLGLEDARALPNRKSSSTEPTPPVSKGSDDAFPFGRSAICEPSVN